MNILGFRRKGRDWVFRLEHEGKEWNVEVTNEWLEAHGQESNLDNAAREAELQLERALKDRRDP